MRVGSATFQRLLMFFYILLLVGCERRSGPAPEESTEPEARRVLHFDQETVRLGGLREEKVDYDFVFRVTSDHPVQISSLNKTCGCVGTDPGLIGRQLLPGQDYKLRVSLALRDKREFREQVVVATDAGQRCYLSISGVHESGPVTVPGVIVCEVPEGESVESSRQEKVFTVHYTRHRLSSPCVPMNPVLTDGNFEIRHLDRDKLVTVSTEQEVVRDELMFAWSMIGTPIEQPRHVMSIPWKSELPSTPVRFTIVRTPLVRGLLSDIYLGRIKRNETTRRVIPLRPRPNVAINVSDTNTPGLEATLREADGLTFLEISVEGHEFGSEFKEAVTLRICDGTRNITHKINVHANHAEF